jgi:AcrR family transcriptional regulator
MARLTRAQQQERTRAAVLAAAWDEFAAHGYVEAKVDRIAERAELTRGAVYSNFPSKRALYLAVLIEATTHEGPPAEAPPPDLAAAMGAFARVWLERLPFTGDTPASGRLQLRSLAGVFDDGTGPSALRHLTQLETLLLARALESCPPHHPRRVRQAELLLTLLHGAGRLAETAPGFGDAFDVARACEHLAGLDLADEWDPAHLPFAAPAERTREDWRPPAQAPDLIPAGHGLDADGIVTVLGTDRLTAAEDAVRAARRGDRVTLVITTADHAERGHLVRLRITDLAGCVRRVFAPDVWRGLRVVLDRDGTVAAAAGIAAPDDDTEAAVRVRGGHIIARATGTGAALSVAATG